MATVAGMIGFQLGNSMYQCPRYWANFIYDLQDREKDYSRDVNMSIIHQELKKYGAIYNEADLGEPNDWISFESEKDFTMFILRWS